MPARARRQRARAANARLERRVHAEKFQLCRQTSRLKAPAAAAAAVVVAAVGAVATVARVGATCVRFIKSRLAHEQRRVAQFVHEQRRVALGSRRKVLTAAFATLRHPLSAATAEAAERISARASAANDDYKKKKRTTRIIVFSCRQHRMSMAWGSSPSVAAHTKRWSSQLIATLLKTASARRAAQRAHQLASSRAREWRILTLRARA